MFANVLRTQARLGLVRAARVAFPATRSLSSLVTLRATAPVVSRFAVRAFSNTMPTSFERARNPPSKTIFIGNIPWDTSKEELTDLFAEYGAIDGEVRLPVDSAGRPRGFAHISFTDEASAVAAVNSAFQEPLHIGGRDLTLDFAVEKRPASSAPPQPNNKIYFTNFEGGENGIRTLFKDFESDILSVFMLRDGNTGAALPNGFVEFTDVDVANNVIEQFNGTELPSGGVLEISYARPRKPRADNNRSDNSRFDPNRRSNDRRGGAYTNRGYSQRNNYD